MSGSIFSTHLKSRKIQLESHFWTEPFRVARAWEADFKEQGIAKNCSAGATKHQILATGHICARKTGVEVSTSLAGFIHDDTEMPRSPILPSPESRANPWKCSNFQLFCFRDFWAKWSLEVKPLHLLSHFAFCFRISAQISTNLNFRDFTSLYIIVSLFRLLFLNLWHYSM